MSEYKYEGHIWRKPRRYPWQVCRVCGLVALRNPLTEWAIDKGCNFKDAVGYKAAIEKYTKVF